MQKLRRILLSEKRRARVSLGLAAAVVTFLALGGLRYALPNVIPFSQAGLVLCVLAAVGWAAVVVEMIRTEIGLAIRALTATCVLLYIYCWLSMYGLGAPDIRYAQSSLMIAGTIGAMTLLLRIRSGVFDRMLATLALIVFSVHLWMLVLGLLTAWFSPRAWIAFLFLPAVAGLLMMLVDPDADSEETGSTDASETGDP